MNNKEKLSRHNEEINLQTRECLQQALILLLMEKPMEKISITELVEKAGVSRTAFYRNYTSKSDVLKDFSTIAINRLAKNFTDPKYEGNTRLWFVNCFIYLKERKRLVTMLLSANLSLNELVGGPSILNVIQPTDDRETYYGYLAAEGGFLNIVRNWAVDGMKEDADQMADLCMRLLHIDDDKEKYGE